MDVICGRCKAEYEFDDALISGTGTTVRCTNCGLKFKVFPAAASAVEEWAIIDAQGTKTQSFSQLAELKRAIIEGRLHPDDTMGRGSQAPRRLRDIPELQPLLAQQRVSLTNTPEEELQQQPLNRSSAAQNSQGPQDPATTGAVIPSSSAIHAGAVAAHAPRDLLATSSDSSDRMAAYDQDFTQAFEESKDTAEQKSKKSLPLEESRTTDTNIGNLDLAQKQLPSPAAQQQTPEKGSSESTSEIPRPTPEHFGAVPNSAARPRFSSAYLTPTPTAIGAYRSASTERVTEIAGLPAPRRAGSRTPLLFLLLGGLAVVVAKYGPLLLQEVDDEKEKLQTVISGPIDQALPVDGHQLQNLETEFIQLLVKSALAESKEDTRLLTGQRLIFEKKAQALLSQFKKEHPLNAANEGERQLNLTDQSSFIRLLRLSGDWDAAYKQLQATPQGIASPFLGPFLDLADPHQTPNYQSLVRIFRDAAIGETFPYLLSSTGIYCLIEAKQLARAKIELGKLQLKQTPEEAKKNELFELLTNLVNRELEAQKKLKVQAKKSSKLPSAQLKIKGEKETTSPAQTPETRNSNPRSQEAPQPVVNSQEIAAKKLSNRADQLWNVGSTQEALTLYRQVVQLLPAEHPLAQRASSRIRRESK